MWAVLVVKTDPSARNVIQMSQAEAEKVVQALPASIGNKRLRERIRIRTLHRCLDDLRAGFAEQAIERGGELGVAVAQ